MSIKVSYLIYKRMTVYIYITDLVCYTHFHWFFNPQCQHIFGKQTGYICTFSVFVVKPPKNYNKMNDKN